MKMRCVICKSKKFFMLCIKTKSSLFLLAYVLFLVCCLLIYPVWDSATAQSIITGIAIAGACFSLADLFYCIQDMKNASVAKQQELYLMTIKVIRDGEERVKSLRLKVNTIKPADVQVENAEVFEKGKDVIERLEKAITEMEPKTKETSIWGNVFMVIGVLLFFLIITFDSMLVISVDISNYCTIIAFLLVVINFYIKQLYSANVQYTLDETRKNCLKGEKFYDDH